jgi:hypothetical protein
MGPEIAKGTGAELGKKEQDLGNRLPSLPVFARFSAVFAISQF